MIKNKKIIIFDWNGTLVNDANIFVDVLNELLLLRNLPTINYKKYRELFCFPVKDFYLQLGVDVTSKAYKILEKQFIEEYQLRMYNANLFDDTIFILDELLKKGYQISMLSASNQLILDKLIDYYGLKKYFNHIVGVNNFSANGKFHKGKKLIEKEKYTVDEIIYIGDTDQDFYVSKKLNIDCILIARGHQSKNRLDKVTDCVINSFNDLL